MFVFITLKGNKSISLNLMKSEVIIFRKTFPPVVYSTKMILDVHSSIITAFIRNEPLSRCVFWKMNFLKTWTTVVLFFFAL